MNETLPEQLTIAYIEYIYTVYKAWYVYFVVPQDFSGEIRYNYYFETAYVVLILYCNIKTKELNVVYTGC